MPKVIGTEDGSIQANYSLIKKDQIYVTKKTFSIVKWVLADTTADTEDTIRLTVGVPQLWTTYNGAVCMRVSPKEHTTVYAHPTTGLKTILWKVKADYDSDVDTGQNQPPNAKPPTVRWHGESEDILLEKDPITGDPIQTKAEEAILLTTPHVLPVLEVSRYETYPFDPDVILDYAHHTNSASFWGAPKGSALMLPMSVDEETIEQVKWCKVTYRIKFKIKKQGANMLEDTWMARILHHGYKYRPSANAEPVTAQDKHGNPITVNLANADGTKLATNADPEFLEFNQFTKVDFNNLSLGPF